MFGIAALVVVLAGCAPVHGPAPAGTHSGSAAASTSAPASSASASAPATPPLVGGDCTRLLDSAALATALGGSTQASVDNGDPLLAVVGGIGCDYAFGKDASSPTSSVSAVIAPSAIADSSEVATSLERPLCTSGKGADCTATVAVAGWWYSLDVTPHKPASAAVLRASFDTITSDLESTLKANPAPKVNAVRQFDCAAPVTPDGHLFGSRVPPPGYSVILGAAFLLAGPTTCSVIPADALAEWSLNVYPGSASAYYQCAHSLNGEGLSVTVPGVKTAFALNQAEDAVDDTLVCATDGTSTITVSDKFHISGDIWDAESLADLGSVLAPAFRSARPSAAPWTASLVAPSAPVTVKPLAGGDCRKLLNTKVAGAALDGSKVRDADVEDPMLATVGGLDCDYVFDDHGAFYEVRLQVAPRAIADPAELEASLVPAGCGVDVTEDDQSTTCTATVALSNWWYSLTVDGFDPDSIGIDPSAAFTAITANIEQTLKSTAAPGRIAAKKPFDCQAADAVGWPVDGSRDLVFSLQESDTEVRTAAFLLAGAEDCEFTAPNGVTWDLTVYPGNASAYYACTQVQGGAGNRSIAVPGVQTAVALPPDSARAVCATDGTSTVYALWGRPDGPPWSTAALKTLGSLLVPAFAASK